jgi:hypothetical protein
MIEPFYVGFYRFFGGDCAKCLHGDFTSGFCMILCDIHRTDITVNGDVATVGG